MCGITIYRVIDIPKSMKSLDVTWDYADNYMWWCVGAQKWSQSPMKPADMPCDSVIETNVAIICACLPCLKAFARRHLGNTWLFRSSAERSVAQALTFLNTRRRTEAVPGGGPEVWDGSRRSRRSMAYVELGDDRSDKSREWDPGGDECAADVFEPETSQSSGLGAPAGHKTGTKTHGPECV